MEKTIIITELNSLREFLSSQAKRFSKLENDFEGDKNTFLSDIHNEMAAVVDAVQKKFDSGAYEPKKVEKELVEGPVKEIPVVEPPVKFEQPLVENPVVETPVEEIPVVENESNKDQPLNREPLFSELSEKERILEFIKHRISALEGTGPEWDCVKKYFDTQIRILEGGTDAPVALDIAKVPVVELPKKNKGNKKPVKKAAKKAAKKTAKKK